MLGIFTHYRVPAAKRRAVSQTVNNGASDFDAFIDDFKAKLRRIDISRPVGIDGVRAISEELEPELSLRSAQVNRNVNRAWPKKQPVRASSEASLSSKLPG